MNKYLFSIVALVMSLFLIVSVHSILFAQEEEVGYAFSTVVSMSSDEIMVSEYDYDSGEEENITYLIDHNIELYNIDSLEDISVGDNIDIDYIIVEDNKRVAKVITIEKLSYEEEVVPLESDEPYENVTEETEY